MADTRLDAMRNLIAQYKPLADQRRKLQIATWENGRLLEALEKDVAREYYAIVGMPTLPEKFILDGVLVAIDVDDGGCKLGEIPVVA